MRSEVESAANFLSDLIRNQFQSFNSQKLQLFRQTIIDKLLDSYNKHWFPEQPFKGSGYRCLRINHKMDPMLSRAGRQCGLEEQTLRSLFPNELTLWIDPNEVSNRIGENGSICVIYDQNDNSLENHSSSPTTSSLQLSYSRLTPSPPTSSLSTSLSSNSSQSSNSSSSSSPVSSPSNWYSNGYSMDETLLNGSTTHHLMAKKSFYLNTFLS